jgi:hypothetical protein
VTETRSFAGTESWQEFEKYVLSIYSAFGYSVVRNVSLRGSQIDLICERHLDGFQRTKIIVECKLHKNGRSVGVADVSKLVHVTGKLVAQGLISGAALITNTEFSQDATAAVGDNTFVALKTVAELESELFDFSHLYNTAVFDYQHEEIFSTYITQSAEIRDLALKATGSTEAVDETLFKRISGRSPTTSIVLADFGGGKTTLLQDLYYKMAKAVLAGDECRRPVFVELKNLHRYQNIKEFIYAAMPGDLPRNLSQFRFNFMKNSGRFSFLLDGFDELRLPDFDAERARVFFELREFVGPNSSIVISCRPTYFSTQYELKLALRRLIEPTQRLLNSLYGAYNSRRVVADHLLENLGKRTKRRLKDGDIKIFSLNSFDEQRIKEYIEKFSARPGSGITSSVDQIYSFISTVYDISDLITRPLLLSIILSMIELKVVDLEETRSLGGPAEIYSLYIESCIDRENDRGSGVDVFDKDERRRICQYIALLMARSNTLRVTWVEMLSYIKNEASADSLLVKKLCGLEIEQISTDIRVCSFLKFEQEESLRFAHKSFMEFLVAQFVFEAIQVRKEPVTKLKVLRTPLSNEILYFLSELVKLNPRFGERLCARRLLSVAKLPNQGASSDVEFFRRNIFTTNLKANFEQHTLAVRDLKLSASSFSSVDLDYLTLENCELSDLSFLKFDVHSWKFTACQLERAEFSQIKSALFEIENGAADIKISESKLESVRIFNSAGKIQLHGCEVSDLYVEQMEGMAQRTILTSCNLEVLSLRHPVADVEINSCEIRQLKIVGLSDRGSLLRCADHIKYRKCVGNSLQNAKIGRLDRETLGAVVENPARRPTMFFVEPDSWQQYFSKETSDIVVRDEALFVRVGSGPALFNAFNKPESTVEHKAASIADILLSEFQDRITVAS